MYSTVDSPREGWPSCGCRGLSWRGLKYIFDPFVGQIARPLSCGVPRLVLILYLEGSQTSAREGTKDQATTVCQQAAAAHTTETL